MASEIVESKVKNEKKYKIVDVSYLDFKLEFVDHEFVTTFVLDFDEVPKRSSPVDVTKGWIRITTESSLSGKNDYVYVHPKCEARLRSFREVKEFINQEYDLVPSDVPGKNLEMCPGLQFYRLLDKLELSIENNRKMKRLQKQKEDEERKGKRKI